MSTRASRGESLPREPRVVSSRNDSTSNNRLSLRLGGAPIGVASLASITSGILIIVVVESLGGNRTAVKPALSIVILLFAPAMLGAIYSVFFEKSKLYGCFDLALSGAVLRMLPFTWYWLGMYVPFACAFTAFCAIVCFLQHRRKR
ncbi:MAG: hypothetical protein WA830_19595 [Candidatus Sulfotelmatobacter sp.]